MLLSTIAHNFGFYHFRGYRLVPCGSFSTIEKLEEDPANAEADFLPMAGTTGLGRGGANGVRASTAAATSVGGSGAAVSSGGGGGLGDGGSDGNKSVVAVYEL